MPVSSSQKELNWQKTDANEMKCPPPHTLSSHPIRRRWHHRSLIQPTFQTYVHTDVWRTTLTLQGGSYNRAVVRAQN